jgi:UDP-glucose 4-epimerase
MRYCVTGGAGFIGSHLSERLMGAGHAVTVLDDLSSGSLANLQSVCREPQFQFLKGDVRDFKTVCRAVRNSDAIIHFAAAVGVRRILTDPLGSMQINVDGTESVLKAALRFELPVLLASSSEVYGKQHAQRLCETADSVFGPATTSRWSYATAKKLDEFLGLAYHAKYGLPVIIARFFNIVGPRQTAAYGSVLPNFVRAALAGRPISVYGDGLQTRNFTGVWDCVEALIALMSSSRSIGEIFNIGTPQEISILDLATLVKRLTGSLSSIDLVPYEEAYPEGGFEDMRSRAPCLCKIQSYTGWAPQYAIDDVIFAAAKHEKTAAREALATASQPRRNAPNPVPHIAPDHSERAALR